MTDDLSRRRALVALAAIVAVGAGFRFCGLAWGAPYYHFHIDEHFVTAPADLMRRSMRDAVMSPKFFMYSPLMMYLINVVRWVYEAAAHTLDLRVPPDEVTYMVLTRALSAAFGTATIPLAYAIATTLSSRRAGLAAAAFTATAVIHLRESHFATTDIAMTTFAVLALWFAVRLADRGDMTSLVGSGAAFGAAILCKYSGAFVLGVIGLAYLLAPGRPIVFAPPGQRTSAADWARWIARGLVPIAVGLALFLILDPLVLQYPEKFRSDIKDWVIDPLTGTIKPAWIAQFADIASPRRYWFTNLLWWGLGPALEITGLAGIAWLFARQDRKALLAAAFPILYFMAAGNTIAPFVRYAVPLAPALAITAGALCGDLIDRSRTRAVGWVLTTAAVIVTAGYAAAYLNVFRQPDSRLQASQWLQTYVPADAAVLVEPSQNTPPMGAYYTKPDFYADYVMWNGETTEPRRDFYRLFSVDVYRKLYNRGLSDEQKHEYLQSRLALADWIVIDDTFLQFYQHLPAPQHGVVKQYYQDLFAGRLGFDLVHQFKVYPSLFGRDINDDAAELTFRLFDHPRVFIFKRR